MTAVDTATSQAECPYCDGRTPGCAPGSDLRAEHERDHSRHEETQRRPAFYTGRRRRDG